MTRRDKTIAGVLGAVVIAAIGYSAVNTLVLRPLAALALRDQRSRETLSRFAGNDSKLRSSRERLKSLALRCFDAEQAGSTVRMRLLALARHSGLDEQALEFNEVAGAVDRKGGFREIVWSVTAEGTLAHATDFLYLLAAEPYLHRVDSLTVRPHPARGEVTLTFTCGALVLKAKKGQTLSAWRPEESDSAAEVVELNTPQRSLYDPIAARDMFRPYIKKKKPPPPPPPPPPAPEPKVASKPSPPPPPPPPTGEEFRVVGLTGWGRSADAPEVLITDTVTGQTREYEIGETIVGATIVSVDYRRLPMADTQPLIYSHSRLIVKIDKEYWSVELGRTFAQRRPMETTDLPEALRSVSEGSGSEQVVEDKWDEPATPAGPTLPWGAGRMFSGE